MTDSVSAPAGSDAPANGSAETRSHAGFWGLAVGSIGVVYGDIGTSPLYALREAVVAASGPEHGELTRTAVLGVVSLILWALFIIVTLKYVVILLRADNNGEGGTLTLMALASRAVGRFSKAAGVVALLGIISAALFSRSGLPPRLARFARPNIPWHPRTGCGMIWLASGSEPSPSRPAR